MLAAYDRVLGADGREPPREARLLHPFAANPAGTTATRISCAACCASCRRAAMTWRCSSPSGPGASTTCCATMARPALDAYRAAYPELRSRDLPARRSISRARLDGADLVIVHEWNEPWLVAAHRARAPRRRRASACCSTTPTTARSATPRPSPPSTSRAMTACSPSARRCRGLPAVGLGRPGLRLARGRRHRLFHPPAAEGQREGLVWIGNWGDGERSEELEQFLLRPARRRRAARSTSTACAIPDAALGKLAAYGARYRGWLPNARGAGGLRPPSRDGARAAPLLRRTCCPASRPSACSRRWPAASRWSRRPGRTARACSARPGLPGGARRGGDARHMRGLQDDPGAARGARRERARRPSARATPAPTASTSCWRSWTGATLRVSEAMLETAA